MRWEVSPPLFTEQEVEVKCFVQGHPVGNGSVRTPTQVALTHSHNASLIAEGERPWECSIAILGSLSGGIASGWF